MADSTESIDEVWLKRFQYAGEVMCWICHYARDADVTLRYDPRHGGAFVFELRQAIGNGKSWNLREMVPVLRIDNQMYGPRVEGELIAERFLRELAHAQVVVDAGDDKPGVHGGGR